LLTDSFGTADAADRWPLLAESCATQFRDFGGHAAFEGVVTTVRCSEDNGMLRPILSEPGAGRVLVVDGGGSLRRTLAGDVTVGIAAANGWAGLVINGAVRDVPALRTLGIGIKALGVNPIRGVATGNGERDVPVVIGGLTIVPGAWLAADADGVLVFPERPGRPPAATRKERP
jgi:regulator of ribonuclease activity A